MHLDVAVDEMVGVLEVVLSGGNDIPEGLLGGLGVEGNYVYIYTYVYKYCIIRLLTLSTLATVGENPCCNMLLKDPKRIFIFIMLHMILSKIEIW